MDLDIYNILKWAGIVIATGFVAQFGKMFAEHLVKRAKKRKEERNQQPVAVHTKQIQQNTPAHNNPESTGEDIPDNKKEKELQKIEKKKLKAEQKQLKKQKKITPNNSN